MIRFGRGLVCALALVFPIHRVAAGQYSTTAEIPGRTPRTGRDAAPQYSVTTVAGTGAFTGDGGAAASAQLNGPAGVALDSAGNAYISDSQNHRIRKVDTAGNISTIAGTGADGFSGDGGPAIAAELSFPAALAIDSNNNIFFVDTGSFSTTFDNIVDTGNSRVRRITPQGIISTVAGIGNVSNPQTSCVISGDGGPATSASLCRITALAIDSQGNIYIADNDSYANAPIIREFTAGGKIYTVAGTGGGAGTPVSGQQTGPGSSFSFSSIAGLAADASGNLYIAGGLSILKMDANRNITTAASFSSSAIAGIAVVPSGAVFFANGYQIFELGQGGASAVLAGDNLSEFGAIAVDKSGAIFVTDYGTFRSTVWKFTGQQQSILAGAIGRYSNNGPALNAMLQTPSALAVDGAGNVYFGESLSFTDSRLDMLSPNGTLTQLLLNPILPTGGSAPSAFSFSEEPIAVKADGTAIYFGANDQIFRYQPGSGITLYAGSLNAPLGGDGGPAIKAGIGTPVSMALDNNGNLYFTDFVFTGDKTHVRKIDAQGNISTVLTSSLAPAAGLYEIPVAVDAAGNVYMAGGAAILKIGPGGQVTTIAGNGIVGNTGDGGPATAAEIDFGGALAVDPGGDVFFTSPGYGPIRMVDLTGTIHTIAGSVPGGSDTGDGGPATAAAFLSASSMAADAAGNVYVADVIARKIRKLTPASLRLEVAAGYAYGALAPDSIASAYGTDLATQTGQAHGTLGTSLQGTTVTIHDSAGNDQDAPLFYVAPASNGAPSQVNFAIPPGTAHGNGIINVKSADGIVSTAPILIESVSPGLFVLNGNNLVAAYVTYAHPDGTQTNDKVYAVQNNAIVPKPINVAGPDEAILVMFGTGIRNAGKSNVTVYAGQTSVHVSYAGPAPGFAGEDQVNIVLPAGLAGAGDVPIALVAGGKAANTVRVTVQ